MALSANSNLVYELGERTTVPVKASSQIYAGSAVGWNSGYARALTAADDFAGFALEKVLGTTDGALNCAVTTSGQVSLTISSIAVTDIGKPVYASDDGTYTLTQGSNSKIGTVSRWVSTGTAIVRYAAQGAGADFSGVTVITDSTGGVDPGDTLAAVTNTDTLTDSTGGTADNTVSPVVAIADASMVAIGGSGMTTAQEAEYDTAMGEVNTAIGIINDNFKEVTDQIITQKTANTAILAAISGLAGKVNELINAAS